MLAAFVVLGNILLGIGIGGLLAINGIPTFPFRKKTKRSADKRGSSQQANDKLQYQWIAAVGFIGWLFITPARHVEGEIWLMFLDILIGLVIFDVIDKQVIRKSSNE